MTVKQTIEKASIVCFHLKGVVKLFTLNKNIITLKKEYDKFQLKNIITGQGIEVDEETLHLIRQFESGLSIDDLLEKFEIKAEEARFLIETLTDLGFIYSGVKKQQIVTPRINSLFESRSKNISFFDCGFEPINNKQIGLVGIPYDGAVTGISGTKLAANKIRQFTSGYTSYVTNIDGVEEKYTLSTPLYNMQTIFDAGNILHVPGESSRAFHTRVRAAFNQLRESYANIFFAIGGDHSISLPILESLNTTNLTFIKIDAHYDSVISYKKQPVNHNNFIAPVRDLKNITQIIHMGVRESLTPSMEIKSDKVITSEEILQGNWKEKIKEYLVDNENIYISIDVDVLDPLIAPGTGYLLPFGLELENVLEIMNFLEVYNIIGIDLVEYNPLLDKNNQTLYRTISIINQATKILYKKEID